MNSNIRQVLKLTISLVTLGLLSGCVLLGVELAGQGLAQLVGEAVDTAVVSAASKPRDKYFYVTGKNYFEPVILASNKEMIRIKYLSVGPYAEREQVKQLMIDHCHLRSVGS